MVGLIFTLKCVCVGGGGRGGLWLTTKYWNCNSYEEMPFTGV
jgi:hypothetical protein